jgi:hypothetical protein
MDSDSQIVQLLTEIRDNQRMQMDMVRNAMSKQVRRMIIIAFMIGGGGLMLFLAHFLQ